MAFEDLSQLFDDRLHLPIDGVVYDIPSPDYELGLWVTALFAAGIGLQEGMTSATSGTAKVPQLHFDGDEYDDDSDEGKLYRRVLGDAYPKLRDNKVSWPKIKLVGETTMLWIAIGEEVAERYWNAGGDPKAIAAQAANNRAGRRAASPRATASTRSGTASTTGVRGSTRGTTSPRGTKRK